MAISDSTFSPDLLGRSVTICTASLGFSFERTGEVVGVLVALPGTRATPAILFDDGDTCQFFDSTDIDQLLIL